MSLPNYTHYIKIGRVAQANIWVGDFGNEYIARNAIDGGRDEFARRIFDVISPTSVLEVGANIGLNLKAMAKYGPLKLMAAEPNDKARHELMKFADVVSSSCSDSLGAFGTASADLVFTCGVLIHIPTDKLAKSMSEIYRVSRRWIVCAEYFAPQEEMIEYRGHKDQMWRRDYGDLFMSQFPDLKCLDVSFLWRRTTGLDNLTVWIFEKGHA